MDRKENETHIAIFNGKGVRKKLVGDRWFFSVVDVVGVLTDSPTPRQYWGKVKDREFGQLQLSPIWVQLKLKSGDGKEYETDCADTESMFRIIQSIPSKKAEPFKLWLARVGYERVQEIENPELAQERMKEIYEKKGYSKSWIDKRLRGIAVRQDLTDEWKERGVGGNRDFAILTDEIAKATFGVSIGEHREIKSLGKENLRDHMDELELIFGMLGEKVTTEITVNKNSEGFGECVVAARQGGEVAGNARKEAEEKIGRSVVSEDNFLAVPEKKKKIKEGKKKKKKLMVVVENG
ncbi:Bro-N domain-containing protein [Candidatus Pacearchaeota archaeon]|nr:Bro-N domain-containing protein [Candidatus Pacearchaeota archaeon]